MARPRTRARVHDAVLELVGEAGHLHVTMEGIAARAGVSKQTLYRSWPTTAAILFDALLARGRDDDGAIAIPDTGDLAADLRTLLDATIAELTEPRIERILRAATAELQRDDTLPDDLRVRLMAPQLEAVRARLSRGGVEDTHDAVELLYGPLLHRWLLRTAPFTPEWTRTHVRRFLRAVGDDPDTSRDEGGGPG